jgi:hypothetical protein
MDILAFNILNLCTAYMHTDYLTINARDAMLTVRPGNISSNQSSLAIIPDAHGSPLSRETAKEG